MQFIIITGMSGAGKSTTLKFLEDDGYFCVDNLPPALITKFAEICFNPESGINKVAIGIDVRGGDRFDALYDELDYLREHDSSIEILFLESGDDVLVKRYKETRRRHPLVSEGGRVQDGIEKERLILGGLKERADYIVDTSNLLTRELKKELHRITKGDEDYNNLMITVMSFGFKYGIPSDSDLVFDVRFIPNPYYKSELRGQTGNDNSVQEYVMQWDVSKNFITKLDDMIEFLIPNYVQEGKNQLVISIGCTGGKHRSVTLANKLSARLSERHYSVKTYHRDIHKDALRGK